MKKQTKISAFKGFNIWSEKVMGSHLTLSVGYYNYVNFLKNLKNSSVLLLVITIFRYKLYSYDSEFEMFGV